LDAVIVDVIVFGDFSLDAKINPYLAVDAFIQPYFFLDAVIGIHAPVFVDMLVRAFISPPHVFGSFTADAVVVARVSFTADAFVTGVLYTGSFGVDAFRLDRVDGSFTVSSYVRDTFFFIDVIIGTFSEGSGYLVVRAWIENERVSTGSLSCDAYIDSYWGEQFTIDADIVGTTKESSFLVDADIAGTGEERGTFNVYSTVSTVDNSAVFGLEAEIEQNLPFFLDAWFADFFTLDAYLSYAESAGSFDVSSWLADTTEVTLSVDAVVVDAGGDYRGFHADAIILGSPWLPHLYIIEVLATIAGGLESSFTLNASISRLFTLDAFFYQPVLLDAYIEGTNVVVYPPAQAGSEGTSTDGTTFSDPSASFDPVMVGGTIVIEGVTYVIASVIDEQTITVVGGGIDFGEGDLEWSVPSGDPTDPVGDEPPITRSFNLLIEWSRPERDTWQDLTGDVLWDKAKFEQSARIGPGTFELSLNGTFPLLVGGEEIRVSVDGFRIFGGYVSDIEQGYIFEDDHSVAVTTLRGTDYNVLLDRLLVYNAEWDDRKEGSGGYKTWGPFSKGTLDREIITTVARRYMSNPAAMGLDMSTYVDVIETPAPTTGFQIESGMSLRNVLTEISRITEGVWWIDPYKNLHYHDRTSVTAPYPITDTDGGIACRELKISRSMSVVTNDVFVWGTAAYLDTGDADIIYSRQTADWNWDVQWWNTKIARVQKRIDAIKQTPYNKRSLKQRTTLAALQSTKRHYIVNLEKAQASTEAGSVETYGRWQYGEFRGDIYHQGKVDRRAKAIMQRYSEPVVKGQATVFEPGFQAGQVVNLVSARHDVSEDIVIRQSTLTFAVVKEPVGGQYFAVPKYALAFGLDPEEPWNVYEYLPYPKGDNPRTHYNPPRIRIEDDPAAEDGDVSYLDTFGREYTSAVDFGPSTSERNELREWSE
ncbi:MAG: hypothetical protein M3094_07290, partial [Actinomycetia bacterium]|nr:hypothetical protein [Actinomycetes bacterium]